MQPPEDLPALIRTDGTNEFAYHTMRVRHPQMIQNIIEANAFPALIRSELEILRDDLVTDAPLVSLNIFPTPPPDFLDWASAHIDQRTPGKPSSRPSWLNTQWFFAEMFLFRMITEITRWWETLNDPYARIKHEELDSESLWEMLEAALTLNGGVIHRLPHLLKMATWGNRMDLSYAAASSQGTTASEDDLLIDDSQSATEHLLRAQLKHFPREHQGIAHIVVDNAGTELAMDLALADALLTGFSDIVVLHVKYHPTFVSDATTDDVRGFIRRCMLGEHGNGNHTRQIVKEMGIRLNQAFNTGRLRLAPNLFWNSPRFMWEMPEAFKRVFEGAQIVIVKGDANYRRVVGDAYWDATTPFADVVSYFPAPILMLRTLKSDAVVGLQREQVAALAEEDWEWRVSGKRGIVQLRI